MKNYNSKRAAFLVITLITIMIWYNIYKIFC